MNSIEKQKLIEAEWFYRERIKAWMLNDLSHASKVNTNFLIALGCLIYTEIIGIFLPKLEKESGKKEERRFYRCLFRLPSNDYLKILDGIVKKEADGGRLYKYLRHGMAHKYAPSVTKIKDGVKVFVPSAVARDGKIIGSDKKSSPIFIDPDGKIIIAYKNYIDELKELVNESYRLTFIDKDPKYQKAAINGIDVILRGK